jgi:hypothetical protein
MQWATIPGKKWKREVSKFDNNNALFNISSPTIIIKETWEYMLGNFIHILEYKVIHT